MSLVQDSSQMAASRLALVAALDHPSRARDAWNALLEGHAFDRLPNAAIRAMPKIYVNIRSESCVKELPRLRGVYRASWSSNLVNFAAIRPVLVAYNELGIDYRAIKGAAISALAGHWGQRTMGDIDVVVNKKDISKAQAILREQGFRALGDDNRWPIPSAVRAQGHYVSASGAVLDLHAPSGRPDLFTQLFTEQGQIKQLLDIDIRIPSAELLLALAVWHATVASAGTDHMQTLIDLGSLNASIDHGKARNILLRSDILVPAQRYVAELESCGLMAPVEVTEWSRQTLLERMFKFRERLRAIWNKARQLSSVPIKLINRRLSKVERQALRKRKGVRARLYEVWCLGGQFGHLERLVMRSLGGFGSFESPGGPIPNRDFRITIPVDKRVPGQLRIQFHFCDREAHGAPRTLFIDGKGSGLVPLPGHLLGIYEVTPERDVVQVSARSGDFQGSSRISHAQVEWVSL